MIKYDVVVIGGGPAGYVAAIKSAQLGKKVACIDNQRLLGGTCLNVGCIPSKLLLDTSYKFYEAKYNLATMGIKCQDVSFSIKKIMERKNSTVFSLGKGILTLLKKNKIDYYHGIGIFDSNHKISMLSSNDTRHTLHAQNIVIATGSVPITLPNIQIDEKRIVTSTAALSFPDVPKKMIIIGAGVIGLELGSVWSRLGANVEFIEHDENILSIFDCDIRKEAKKIFEHQGLKFRLSSRIKSAITIGNKVQVKILSTTSNNIETLECDILLVAVGRKPNTHLLNLNKIGIMLDMQNRIDVNNQFRTNISNIYAIGDVIKGHMLAHKAYNEGIAVAEIIDSQYGSTNSNTIPSVVYTHPEIASIGKTEHEIQRDGIEYNIGKFPFSANSKAKIYNQFDGFVKVIACKKTDLVLGIHIIGHNAGELIAEAAVAMEFKASSEDLSRICNPHPTLNEAIKEASLNTYFKTIHL